MFEGWDNYFVLTGTASGGLIGLLFVVATLTGGAGFDRERALRGSEIYMTPNLVHFAVVLVASGAVLAQRLSPRVDAIVLAGAGLAGLGNAVRTCRGIATFAVSDSTPHWTDLPLYGALPGVLYLVLIGIGVMVWEAAPMAPFALAALVMALMLLAIRNAWDLITWMAAGLPQTPPSPPAA